MPDHPSLHEESRQHPPLLSRRTLLCYCGLSLLLQHERCHESPGETGTASAINDGETPSQIQNNRSRIIATVEHVAIESAKRFRLRLRVQSVRPVSGQLASFAIAGDTIIVYPNYINATGSDRDGNEAFNRHLEESGNLPAGTVISAEVSLRTQRAWLLMNWQRE